MSVTTNIKLLQTAYLASMYGVSNDDRYNTLANLGQRYGEKGSGMTSMSATMNDIATKLGITNSSTYILALSDGQFTINGQNISTIPQSSDYSNISVNGFNISYVYQESKYAFTINQEGYIEKAQCTVDDVTYIISNNVGVYTLTNTENSDVVNLQFNTSGESVGWSSETGYDEILAKFNTAYNEQLSVVTELYNSSYNTDNVYGNFLYNIYNYINEVDFADNGNISEEITSISIPSEYEFHFVISTESTDEKILFTEQPVQCLYLFDTGTDTSTDVIYVCTTSGTTRKLVGIDVFTIEETRGEYTINGYQSYFTYHPYIGQTDNNWYINNVNSGIQAVGSDADQPNIVFIKTAIESESHEIIGKVIGHSSNLFPALSCTEIHTVEYKIGLLNDTTKNIQFALPSINNEESQNTISKIKNLLICNISDVYYDTENHSISEITNDVTYKCISSFWEYDYDEEEKTNWIQVTNGDDTTPLTYTYLSNIDSVIEYITETNNQNISGIINSHQFDDEIKWVDKSISPKQSAQILTHFALKESSSDGTISLCPYVNISDTFFSGSTSAYNVYPSINLNSVMLSNASFNERLSVFNTISSNMTTIPYYAYFGAYNSDFCIGTQSTSPTYFNGGNLFTTGSSFQEAMSLYIKFNNLRAQKNIITQNLVASDNTSTIESALKSSGIYAKNAFILESFNRLSDMTDLGGCLFSNRVISGDNSFILDSIENSQVLESGVYVSYLQTLVAEMVNASRISGGEGSFGSLDVSGTLSAQTLNLSNGISVNNSQSKSNSSSSSSYVGQDSISTKTITATNGNITNISATNISANAATSDDTTTKNLTVSNSADIRCVNGGWLYYGGIYQKNITAIGTLTPLGTTINTTTAMFYYDSSTSSYFLNLGAFLNKYARNLITGETSTDAWSSYMSLIQFQNNIYFNGSSSSTCVSPYSITVLSTATQPLLKLNGNVNLQFDTQMIYPEFQVTLKQNGSKWLCCVSEVAQDDNSTVKSLLKELEDSQNEKILALQQKLNDLQSEINSLRSLINTKLKYDANGGTLNS